MDSTITAAVIGALSTVGATIGTFILARIPDSTSFSTQNVRQISLTGHWEGTVHQEGMSPYQFTVLLKSTREAVQGEGFIRITSPDRNISDHLTFKGKFVYDRFLKVEYKLGDRPGLIQFGYILLELHPDGQTLEGRWIGYGSLISRSMVHGTTQIHRQGSIPQISK